MKFENLVKITPILVCPKCKTDNLIVYNNDLMLFGCELCGEELSFGIVEQFNHNTILEIDKTTRVKSHKEVYNTAKTLAKSLFKRSL